MPRGRKASALIAALAATEAVTVGFGTTAAWAGTVTGAVRTWTFPGVTEDGQPRTCGNQNFSVMITTQGTSRTARSEIWYESSVCNLSPGQLNNISYAWKNGALACQGAWKENSVTFSPGDVMVAGCQTAGNTQPAGAAWAANGTTAIWGGSSWYYWDANNAGPAYT